MTNLYVNATAPLPKKINQTRWFIPERITHFYYSPLYKELSAAQRLRYNQLFALYVNELSILFERILSTHYSQIAEAQLVPLDLCGAICRLVAEEREHTKGFILLNQLAAPTFYSSSQFYFVKAPRFLQVLDKVRFFTIYFSPAIVFLATLQEERILFYAKQFVKNRESLDEIFYEEFAEHSQDEADHVDLNFALLANLWRDVPPIRRRLNGAFANWLMRNFLLAPKRAGVRVLEQLIREFPELEGKRKLMLSSLSVLSLNQVFLNSLYSLASNPRSFSFIKNIPELSWITKLLPLSGDSSRDG